MRFETITPLMGKGNGHTGLRSVSFIPRTVSASLMTSPTRLSPYCPSRHILAPLTSRMFWTTHFHIHVLQRRAYKDLFPLRVFRFAWITSISNRYNKTSYSKSGKTHAILLRRRNGLNAVPPFKTSYVPRHNQSTFCQFKTQ